MRFSLLHTISQGLMPQQVLEAAVDQQVII
jgi:hypothetical protein